MITSKMTLSFVISFRLGAMNEILTIDSANTLVIHTSTHTLHTIHIQTPTTNYYHKRTQRKSEIMLRASAVAAAASSSSSSPHTTTISQSSRNNLFRKRSNTIHNNHRNHDRSIYRIVVGAFLTAAILLMIMLLYGMHHVVVVVKKPTPSSPMRGRSTSNHPNQKPLQSSPSSLRQQTPPKRTLPSTKEEATQIIAQIRKDFSERYGSYAPTLLEKGIQAFGSLDATAHRMIHAYRQQRPFVMAFTGYSVTVGRGNFFNQSFPFVVQRILQVPLQQVLGIPLQVTNAAIGGIPSFPYSFCLEHFVGLEADVLSWDYSMNEGKSAASVEAFLRQALQQLPHHPMMILLDRQVSRQALLQDYTQLGLVHDALMVGRKEDIWGSASDLPPPLTNEAEAVLPPGFQDWNVFGAPAKCPGHGNWHPKQQEHSMIGWMMGMHFIDVLERAHEILWEATADGGKDVVASLAATTPTSSSSPIIFPKPLSPKLPSNADPAVNELLFGHEVAPNQYHMKDLSCRTSFVPATDASKTLPSIVVQGTAETDLDIMVDRTLSHYQEGWIMDVSPVERKTKRQVERCGGLGYQDMKIALYGIPESGTLRLWLPYEPKHTVQKNHHDAHDHDDVTDAKHWFDDFLLCEANEKRPDSACQLHQDLDIVVGGVSVPTDTIQPMNGVAEYLKRKTCVNVGIPPGAQITTLGAISTMDGQTLSEGDKVRLFDGPDESVGLLVDITAKSKVTLANGACCLSHIVWEMH